MHLKSKEWLIKKSPVCEVSPQGIKQGGNHAQKFLQGVGQGGHCAGPCSVVPAPLCHSLSPTVGSQPLSAQGVAKKQAQ